MNSVNMSKYKGFNYITTNYLTLEKIKIDLPRYTSKYVPKYNASTLGWDTETENDKLRIIAKSDGETLVYNDDPDTLWSFIMQRKHIGKYNIMFNMRYDYTAFLVALGLSLEQYKELLGDKHYTYVYAKNKKGSNTKYKLSMLNSKFFSFKDVKNKHTVTFYDLRNFCKGSLDYNARKLLDLTEKQKEIMRMHKEDRAIMFNKYTIEENCEYCITDAKYTVRLFNLYCDAYKKLFKNPPPKPYSMASWAGTQLRLQCYIPKMRNLPDGLLEFWMRGFSGGRFEIMGRGSYKQLYLTDITGAYPDVMKDLYNPCDGIWRKTKRMNPDCTYGIYKVLALNKEGKYMYPLPFRYINGGIVYPQNDFITYAIKEEIELLDDYEIINGWEFTVDRPYKPLYNFITNNQYNRKKSYDKGLTFEGDLLKGMNVSSFGKMVQLVGGHNGKLFNPIWGTLITALTRVKMFKDGIKNHTLAIHSDSIITEKPLKGITLGKELGNYDQKDEGEGWILGSGRYRVGEEYGERGFSDLLDALKNSDGLTTKIRVPQTRVVTIGQIVHAKYKYPYEDLNKFIESDYILDINSDYKRDWDRSWNSLNDFWSNNMGSIPPLLVG